LALARAARVVDVRNVGRAHRRIEQFYFVYFSNEISADPLRVLADQERLVINQTSALRRWIEGSRQGSVYISFPARGRIAHKGYGDMMPLPVAQVYAQRQDIQQCSVGQLEAHLPIE
jgi:hypothetical protein